MPDQMGAMDVLGPEFKNINFIYKQCSVTDEPKLRTYMTQIKDEFKRLDIIINSSAVLDEMNSKRTIDINYVSVLFFKVENIWNIICRAEWYIQPWLELNWCEGIKGWQEVWS